MPADPSHPDDRTEPIPVRPRRRRRTVAMLVLSHLVLAVGGGVAFVGMLWFREDARQAQRALQALRQDWDAHQEKVHRHQRRTRQALDRLEADLARWEARLGQPGPTLSAATAPSSRHRHYTGPVLPEAVLEEMVRHLELFRGLDEHAETLRQYHRFITRSETRP